METAEKVQQIDGAILINTARGGLIDEQALYDALMQRKLYTAALDVVKKTARLPHSFGGLPHCIITGHIAWLTKEARLPQ